MIKMEEKEDIEIERVQWKREQRYDQTNNNDEESRSRLLKQHMLVEQQTRDIQVTCTSDIFWNLIVIFLGINEVINKYDVGILRN